MAQWQRWFNASVLKTESRKRLVGSNPTCVAKGMIKVINAETYVRVLLKKNNIKQVDLLNKMKELKLADDKTLVRSKLNNAINTKMGYTWARRIEIALDLPEYSIVKMVGRPTEYEWKKRKEIGKYEMDERNSERIYSKSK